MAHFAQLDDSNTVLQVLVVNNSDIDNLPFPESEPVGIAFLDNIFPGSKWAQTSYNGSFRVRYAAEQYVFVPNTSASQYGGFAPPKGADYFIWDDPNCQWIPPVPYPSDGKVYYWNFATRQWELMNPQPPVQVTVIG